MSKLTDDILSNVDIVDVISKHVSLKRSGSNFSGCCPFHNEKTPSFMVSPTKQIFKCFGCGKGWNVFTFVQEIERIDFWDAVKILANDARIDISTYEYDHKKRDGQTDSKEKMKRIHKLAQQFFVDELATQTDALDYLHLKRHLSDEMIKEFGIGYAPESHYALGQFLKGKGFTEADLAEASLLKKGQNTDYYTFFRKRITFPIYDTMQNIIGFSARVLDPNDNPKYLNSAEHAAFEKSKVLYGLNRAKQYVTQHNAIIIVEGQMDVIALHRLGFPIAVATSGTALTEQHIKLLKRYTDNLYLLFDSDSAGQAATLRALNIAYQYDLFPKKITLPEWCKDADDVANQEWGSELFAKVFADAQDAFMATIDQLKNTFDITSPVDRQKVLNILFGLVQSMNNISLQQHYIQVMADVFHSPYEIISSQYKKYTQDDGKLNARYKQATPSTHYQENRDMLFAALFFRDFLAEHQDTPTLWDPLFQLKDLFIEHLPQSTFAELLSDPSTETAEQLNETQLRREKEFTNNDETRKYLITKQTLWQVIKWLSQQLIKLAHLSHEDKQRILTLTNAFAR